MLDPAALAVRSTWLTTGNPPTGCRTLGNADRIRVPSPAARMMESSSAIEKSPFSPLFGGHFHKNMAHDSWRTDNEALNLYLNAPNDS